MKLKGIIFSLLCICTIHILAQQPKTIVFKVRKNNVNRCGFYGKGNGSQGIAGFAFGPNKEPSFIVVEENATFNGGDLGAFRNWVQGKLVYPKASAEKGSEGRVFIQFAINATGDVCDVKVLRSSGDILLDEEAIRAVKTSPKWVSARQSGKTVKQQFTLPITFKMLQ